MRCDCVVSLVQVLFVCPNMFILIISVSEDYGEYLVVRGTNLSNQNLLKYFQLSTDSGTLTPEEEAEICSSRK